MENPCTPTACGACPLAGMCGDPTDLPPEPLSGYAALEEMITRVIAAPAQCRERFEDAPDRDPAEPRPADAPSCCGGNCGA